MMVRYLYIFRHGETDWNAEQRFQGHQDVPLNARGRKQAMELVKPLKRMEIQAIYSSDLSRARETGGIVAREIGVPVFTDRGLREACLGGAEGLTVEEIAAKFGRETVEKWKSPFLTDADASYPGGETGKQVLERALEALLRMMTTHPFEHVGVATHGGVIRRMMRHLLGESSTPVPIPNGILYPVQYDLSRQCWVFAGVSPLKRAGS